MMAKKPTPAKKPARTNPPDRDGDNEPGGSLPGNKTVASAKGSLKRDYRTRLCAEDEAAFQQWVEPGYDDSPTTSYDARGYWHAAVKNGEDISPALFRTPFHEDPVGSRWL
jgi:hypothetical protein